MLAEQVQILFRLITLTVCRSDVMLLVSHFKVICFYTPCHRILVNWCAGPNVLLYVLPSL